MQRLVNLLCLPCPCLHMEFMSHSSIYHRRSRLIRLLQSLTSGAAVPRCFSDEVLSQVNFPPKFVRRAKVATNLPIFQSMAEKFRQVGSESILGACKWDTAVPALVTHAEVIFSVMTKEEEMFQK